MTFNDIQVQGKKALGIFDLNFKNNSHKNEIVAFAADYWANAITNAIERQIGCQMGNGIVVLSDKEIEKFKKAFINHISKVFPEEGSIMLWTSDGENFDKIGTDAYLPVIMKNCNLPLTCLPSDLCMWISSKQIVVENNLEQEVVYSVEKQKKMDVK